MPSDGEYIIESGDDNYVITANPSGSLWVNYAETIPPSGISYVQLEGRFTSTDGDNTPTLRSYELVNKII